MVPLLHIRRFIKIVSGHILNDGLLVNVIAMCSCDSPQGVRATDLNGYELSNEEQRRLHRELTAAGREALLLHVREAAHTALSRMKDRCVRTRE